MADPAPTELPEDTTYDGDDAPTSPRDHGFFHVGDDWEFSPGFWNDGDRA